jgi:hypothetical protein
MGNKKPPRESFTIHLPDQQEPEREMPDRLEVVDYQPSKRAKKPALQGGAYDPYSSDGTTGDTARTRKPRVDLRKLSEWIKTTQEVKALREQDPPPDADSSEPD